MPERQFQFMREILAAPSPIGLEAAMSYGVLKPYFEKLMPRGWGIHQFRGNAGLVVDTHPGEDDRTSVMVVGHNPGLEGLVYRLSGELESMPTAAIAHFTLEIDDWSETNGSFSSRLLSLWRPKDLT